MSIEIPASLVNERMSSGEILLDIDRTRFLLVQFDHLGQRGDLDEAFQSFATYSANLHRTASWKAVYGLALALRYEEYGDGEDFDKAWQVLDALVAVPGPALAASLYGLGRLLQAREAYTASTGDLDGAITCYRQVLEIAGHEDETPSYDIREVRLRLLLALSRRLLYTAAQSSDFIEPSDILQDVIHAIEEGSILQPLYFFCHAYFLYRQWIQGGRNKSDLQGSLNYFTRAVDVTAMHRLRCRSLMHRGDVLARMYDNYGGPIALIHESVAALEEAARMREPRGPRDVWYRAVLMNIGQVYMSRFRIAGDLEDLDRAVDAFHLTQPPILENICASLCNRYAETGQRTDIDDAVSAARGCVADMTSPKKVVLALANLGLALSLRFRSEGNASDFAEAKEALEGSLDRIRPGDGTSYALPSHCHRLLAEMFKAKFRFFNPGRYTPDIEVAILHFRKGLALLPSGHLHRPSYLSELGECLSARSHTDHSGRDLVEAIHNHEQALLLAPAGYADRHLFMWRYAHALRLRFALSREMGDIDKAIAALGQAIGWAETVHHPQRSKYVSELAACHSSRCDYIYNRDDLDLAIKLYALSAEMPDGYAKHRFDAAVAGARLAQDKRLFDHGTRLYSVAISLLPRIAWLGHFTDVRYTQLASVGSNFASDAAACALAAGLIERSVELLDEGRSVLWKSSLELRADLNELEHAVPELARELREVGQALEHGSTGLSEASEAHVEIRSQRRRRLAERWDALIEDVRKLQDFKSFLKPLPFSVLQQAAKEGPVVILNISAFRSDALLISTQELVRTVPLPGLDRITVMQLAYMLSRGLQVARDPAGCAMLDRLLVYILRRLWHGGLAAVAKVLTALPQTQHHARLPHVWWIPTGLLSMLPLHCAGPFDGRLPGILDLAISSYTATMSTLLVARAPRASPPPQSRMQFSMLAISVPTTPDFALLPSAQEEMAQVNETLLKESIRLVDGEKATIESVARLLPDFNWLHICCHGRSDRLKPLNSSFHLYDGSLSLSRIIQLRLINAEFAFLSACHSASYTSILPDESLTIATGLQVAGFRGIVGSAWSMADIDGPLLAKHFYRSLTMDGRAPEAKNAAEALRSAIIWMRDAGIPLCRWATFIHIGI